MPRPHSHSELADMDRCQLMAVESRRANYAAAPAAISGNITHAWIQQIQDRRNAGLEIDFQSERARFQSLTATLEQPDRDDTLVAGLVWLKLQLEQGWQVPANAKSELSFGLTRELWPCSFDSAEATYRGIADAVAVEEDGRHLKVWDYKTGYKLPSVTDWLQLEREAFALMQHFPNAQKATLVYVYTRHCADVVTQRTRDELQWIADDIRRRCVESDAVWLLDEPKATLNQYCGYCPIQMRCPELLKADKLPNKAQASYLVSALEKMTTEVKALMSQMANLEGPLPAAGGGTWSHRIRKNARPTAEEVIRWAQRAGVPNQRILEQARFSPEAVETLETIAGRSMEEINHPYTQFRKVADEE